MFCFFTKNKSIAAGSVLAASIGAAAFLYDGKNSSQTFCDLKRFHPSTFGVQNFEPSWHWNSNWDGRDPQSRIRDKKYHCLSEEDLEKKLVSLTPVADRHLILIRHGQYVMDSETRNLTPLGREQAALLGKRLLELNNKKMKFDSVIMSTMPRATETANIILEKMGSIAQELVVGDDSIIEEGAPFPPEPPVSHWRPEYKFFNDGARIEAAFRKYFHRASPKQKKDSYELIVCHANVIRYFVCRALQLPPEAWLRFSLANSSITWILIRNNGSVSVRTIGDFGHLPPDKITFT